MANEVAVFNPKQLPSFAKTGEVSAIAKALAGGSGGFGKRLSIKGGVFRLVVDGKEVSAIDERYLDVVIVAAAPKVGRTWYAKKFSDDNNQGPACWSSNGDTPDPASADKQSETCATCEKNVKGSGEGDSRACRYSQRVAVVLANDMEGNVMQLSVPAKSIFGESEGDKHPLQAYAKWLIAQNISPEQVITRLRFDTKEESPKLFFKTMRWLTEDEYPTIVKQGQTKEAHDAIIMTVSQANKDEPFQQPKKDVKEEAPAPKANGKKKPAADDGEEAPPPEPKVRAKAEPAELPKKPGLAAVIASWDEDD